MNAVAAATVEQIAARLADVRGRIERAGRDPDDVTVIAVTKGQPIDVCRAAVAAGLTQLGENRVQEALPKLEELVDAEWHLIGHLQTNKVRQVPGRFALIQSLDSERLADQLAERAPQQRVLVQVNVAREGQKHGVEPERAADLVGYAAKALRVEGLMAMAPLDGEARPAFEELARLRSDAEQRAGIRLPILSMGMSGDFEAAVRCGSTMVRLGRVLFGERREERRA